jgi:hypothetical protein
MAYKKRCSINLNRLIVGIFALVLFQPFQSVAANTNPGLIDNLSDETAPATLKIVVPPGPYAVNDVITVSVEVDTTVNTRGAQFALTFNPAVLQCNNVNGKFDYNLGAFYKDWVASVNNSIDYIEIYDNPKPKCYNTGNVSDTSISVLGDISIYPGGATGHGVVATYSFKIISEGHSAISFLDDVSANKYPKLFDDANSAAKILPLNTINSEIQIGSSATSTFTATPVPADTEQPSATVTRTPYTPSEMCMAADINQDGEVNVGDLSLIGSYWNEIGTPGWIPEDVNSDGVVNIGDLLTVGNCWNGENPPTNTEVPTSVNQPTYTFTPYYSITPSSTPSRTSTRTSTPEQSPTQTLTITPSKTLSQTSAVTPTYDTVTQLRIEPANKIIGVGQQFDVTILLNTKHTIRGAQVNISFDPTVLRCDSVEQGDFFTNFVTQWNGDHADDPDQQFDDPFTIPGAIDNVNGILKDPYAISLNGPVGEGPFGSGSFLVLKFTSLKLGTSRLQLTGPEIYSTEMEIVPKKEPVPVKLSFTTVDGSVEVSNSAATSTATVTLTPSQTPTATNTTSSGSSSSSTPTRTVTNAGGGGIGAMKSNTPQPTEKRIPSSSRIGFDPGQSMIAAVGDTFTVNASVNADKPVRGATLNLKFDPNILECQKVEEGDFIKNWASQNGGSTMVFPTFKIDNAAGKITDGAIIYVGSKPAGVDHFGGATGIGPIIKITFKAKAVGVSQLNYEYVGLIDDTPGTNKYETALDLGEVFVGVTPTATPLGGATATGGAGSYSSTQGNGTAGVNRTVTVTPTGGAGGNKTTGIVAPKDAVVIPDTGTNPNQFIGSLLNLIDENGILLKDVILQSKDNQFAVFLAKGVQALTADNHPLSEVTITKTDQALDKSSSFKLIGTIFDLGTSGAVFNPPIKIVFAYSPDNLPEGVLPEDLVVGYFNPDKNQWVELKSELDTKAGTVTAYTDHFSLYGLLAKPAGIRVGWVVGGIIGFIVLLSAAVLTTLFLKKRAIKDMDVVDGEIVNLLTPGPIGLLEAGSDSEEEIPDSSEDEISEDLVINPEDTSTEESDLEDDEESLVQSETQSKGDVFSDPDLVEVNPESKRFDIKKEGD